MYVCMYISAIYVYICVCVYVYIYCVYVCVHTSKHTHMLGWYVYDDVTGQRELIHTHTHTHTYPLCIVYCAHLDMLGWYVHDDVTRERELGKTLLYGRDSLWSAMTMTWGCLDQLLQGKPWCMCVCMCVCMYVVEVCHDLELS